MPGTAPPAPEPDSHEMPGTWGGGFQLPGWCQHCWVDHIVPCYLNGCVCPCPNPPPGAPEGWSNPHATTGD